MESRWTVAWWPVSDVNVWAARLADRKSGGEPDNYRLDAIAICERQAHFYSEDDATAWATYVAPASEGMSAQVFRETSDSVSYWDEVTNSHREVKAPTPPPVSPTEIRWD